MQLTSSRLELSQALNEIDGVTVHSVWPNKITGPSVIYQRTNTSDGYTHGSGEGSMDTNLQYTVYILSNSLTKAEKMGDDVVSKMRSIGYNLSMSANNEPNQLVLTFSMTIDNTTHLAIGRR